MKTPLGKLKQVKLRDIWKHEALDFTKWLALEENIELLSEEIDIDISTIETEYNVGRFSVDVYAEEKGNNRKIIIENQLERTDHDHLGKLITYGSGLEAEILIWIVKEVLEEHQQAIDWLNEHTDEKLNFFLIKMEVWQIGNSSPAPKFHIISKPNNWGKIVRQASQKKALTETKLLQLEFWEGFKAYVETNSLNLKARKAHPQHWYTLSIGRSDCRIELTVNSQKNEMGCEIYIEDSEETYQEFYNNNAAIEAEVGRMEWMELPEKKASRIKQSSKCDINKKKDWDGYFRWLSQKALQFQETFNKY